MDDKFFRVVGRFSQEKPTLRAYREGELPMQWPEVKVPLFEGTLEQLRLRFPLSKYPQPIDSVIEEVGKGTDRCNLYLEISERYRSEDGWRKVEHDPRFGYDY